MAFAFEKKTPNKLIQRTLKPILSKATQSRFTFIDISDRIVVFFFFALIPLILASIRVVPRLCQSTTSTLSVVLVLWQSHFIAFNGKMADTASLDLLMQYQIDLYLVMPNAIRSLRS